MRRSLSLAFALLLTLSSTTVSQVDEARLERLKAEALQEVEGRARLVQKIVDMPFPFGELGSGRSVIALGSDIGPAPQSTIKARVVSDVGR